MKSFLLFVLTHKSVTFEAAVYAVNSGAAHWVLKQSHTHLVLCGSGELADQGVRNGDGVVQSPFHTARGLPLPRGRASTCQVISFRYYKQYAKTICAKSSVVIIKGALYSIYRLVQK